MPILPGEELLVTVYADIHYYFAPPSIRPVLHRFDKASYFYFYYNATRQTSRIEVANNPGSSDQDAFHGYLDKCRVINSHRFPTLITLVVDAAGSASSSPSSRSARDPDEWRLSSNDPRDTGNTKYRLHTLDIYFWAQEDSKLVVDTFKAYIPPSQLDITEIEAEEDVPESRHQEAMSPVVQNLEKVAISDPSYQNGQTRNSLGQPQQATTNVLPPPPHQQPPTQQPYQPTSSVSPVSAMSDTKSAKSNEPAQTFAPLAYNPAAPPAPEPIAHREDTPPPPEDGQGIGLAAAAVHDNPAAYGRNPAQTWTGVPQAGHQPYQIGQPPPGAQTYGSPPPPPSSASTFSGPPAVPGQDGRHHSVAAQNYVPDPHSQMFTQSQQPVETPGAQFYPTSPGQPHKPLQHNQPQYADYLSSNSNPNATQSPPPPVGGYVQYNYAQAPGQPQQNPHANPYDVHNQVYRPTEQEYTAHGKNKRTNTAADKSKWESRAEKVEKKGGKFLKKLGI